MCRFRLQRSRALISLGLFLVLLANLGLTVHAGHHSFLEPYSAAQAHLLVEHSEPDLTLHLESVTEVRTLSCPGCLLQQQIGGSYLRAQWSPDSPSRVGARAESLPAAPTSLTPTAQTTRGPPSC